MSTIAAISTAPGNAGIGIIRLSGEKCFEIIEKIFVPKKKSPVVGYSMKYGKIINSQTKEVIDEVLVSYFVAPKSYTVEVQYKNIATDETIASQKIEINKKDEDTTIDIVKELTVNQQQYVLVNGQSITINHSFYSPRRIYTIYYRNVNDPINVDTEIIREEVIEVEGQSSVIGGQTIYRRNNQTGAFSTVGVENRDGSENNSNEGSTSSVDGINVEDEAVPQANIDAQSQESSSSQVYYLVAGLLAVLIVIVIILKRKKHGKEV